MTKQYELEYLYTLCHS